MVRLRESLAETKGHSKLRTRASGDVGRGFAFVFGQTISCDGRQEHNPLCMRYQSSLSKLGVEYWDAGLVAGTSMI